MEVNRPDRSTRRRIGKDDTIDAEAAARAYIAGTAAVIPKAGDDLGGLRSGEITTPLAAATMTLHTLARRIQQLDQELKIQSLNAGSAGSGWRLAMTSSALMSCITVCNPDRIDRNPARRNRFRAAVRSVAIAPAPLPR